MCAEVERAAELGKFNQMDAQHIKATDQLQSGYFAAYRLYEFCPDFASYFAPEQKEQLNKTLQGLDTSLFYQGYTQLLSSYHSVPVVITGYGFSSSRGTDNDDGPLTEEAQGHRLVTTYDDIIRSGCSGALITSWQDVWGRRTWNTSYAVDVGTTDLWHDIQTDGTGYGLLSFDPGKEENACYVDGDPSEWTEKDILQQKDGTTLSARYDERNLYLLLQKEGLSQETAWFLPIDVTPKSGSKRSASPSLAFEREADFLLCLQGKDNSRLLVQSRYEAVRENYLAQIAGEDPFVDFPAKDDPLFVPIRMILRNQKLVPDGATEEEILAARKYETFETGRLVYGNGNPNSASYNSLADFSYGDNCIEVRIPWQLINFRDPSQMSVHDDYYEHYGVQGLLVKEIYLGVHPAGEEGPITMVPFSLKGWGEKPEYHERLKQSYNIVKESWGDQHAL